MTSESWTREELAQMPRAWKVSDGDRADIVYARNPGEARRAGAAALDGSYSDDDLEVERAEEFDDLKGRSLRQAQLEEGWWFGCHAPMCEKHVTWDGPEPDYFDEPEEGAEESAPIVVIGDSIYCSQACVDAETEYYIARRRREWDVVEAAVAQWPGIVIVEWDGWRYGHAKKVESEEKDIEGSPLRVTTVREIVGGVRFTFPGSKGMAAWSMGDENVELWGGEDDAAAWEKFRGRA